MAAMDSTITTSINLARGDQPRPYRPRDRCAACQKATWSAMVNRLCRRAVRRTRRPARAPALVSLADGYPRVPVTVHCRAAGGAWSRGMVRRQ